MDDIKDIQRTDSLSRFLDQHVVRTTPFGENRAADRAYRRAERMSAALHLLTAHIPAVEAVRHRIRQSATELLVSVMDLQGDMRSARSPHVAKVLSDIRYAISLVRLAAVSGYVSLQNATTIVEALDELGSFISAAQRSSLSEQISISREDLVDVGMSAPRLQMRRTIKRMSVGESQKDTVPVKDSTGASNVQSASLRELSVRVQNILDILRSGGSLGIRDIAANLPEYSEKMIQRELLDLVTQGKVTKTGLKRWSKYSLVAQ